MLPSRSTRPSKVQISLEVTNFSKKYSVLPSHSALKWSTSSGVSILKVAAAPTPLSGLAINGNPIFFTALSMSFSVLTTAPGTTGTPAFLKSFFISDLNLVFFRSFGLAPKTLNCSRSAASNSNQYSLWDSIRSIGPCL